MIELKVLSSENKKTYNTKQTSICYNNIPRDSSRKDTSKGDNKSTRVEAKKGVRAISI